MENPDNKGEKDFDFSETSGEIHRKLKCFIENTSIHIRKNISTKKVLMVFMITVIVALSFGVYKMNEVKTRGYTVYYGEQEIGIVRQKEEAISVLDGIRKNLSNTYSSEIVLNEELSFVESHTKDSNLTSVEEIKNNIESQLTFLVSGYALMVDGQSIGYSKSKEELEKILEEVKEPYIDSDNENSKLIELNFVEDVTIENEEIPLNKLSNSGEILEYIKTGGEDIKTHIVEVGESLWTIAMIYDVSVDELIEVNSEMDPEKLQIGDEIILNIPDSLVTVVTVEEVEYTADTEYEVIVENDANMYKTQRTVTVEGKKGKSNYLANITKYDGKIVKEDILQEEIIEKPVDELVVQGTKELPKTAATGAFLMPTRGRLSSRYGMRSGRMHYGIDLACSTGTPIEAADGGKVTFSGWKNSYGYIVEIDHENGYATKYAHCSSLNVSTGDRVYKGQVIAKVGSTGRSTGSHLHFEVLKDGKNVNPANYVN